MSYIPAFLPVCLPLCVWYVHVCTCLCMCIQWSEDGIVYLTPPLFLETGSLTEPGTYFFSSWPTSSQGPPVFPSHIPSAEAAGIGSHTEI